MSLDNELRGLTLGNELSVLQNNFLKEKMEKYTKERLELYNLNKVVIDNEIERLTDILKELAKQGKGIAILECMVSKDVSHLVLYKLQELGLDVHWESYNILNISW